MISVDSLSNSNCKSIASLAFKLWPDSSLQEEIDYFSSAVDDPSKTAFLLTVDNKPVGFVLATLRTDYVEGTSSSPVCYVEGIYVEPAHRGTGLAEKLIQQAEHWGREKECKEIASDATIENAQSIAFHKKVGFEEVNRVVCFSKPLL